MTQKFILNKTLDAMGNYASKTISIKASQMPDVMNLSFGEPEFGPPDFLRSIIETDGLSWNTFIHSVKGYEQPKGSLELRVLIADWYQKRYGVIVDPEKEIMITHGGVEAINLAIQCTTQENQGVIISHPSYMLYEKAVTALNRKPVALNRPLGKSEYHSALKNDGFDIRLQQAGVMIVNSPENPSGYVLDARDWDAVSDFTNENGIWLVHDEVYDVMSFSEVHHPALQNKKLRNNTIMINSFSKKFGLPGLRIGWMVANENVINMAAKLHDYFYLGVNKQYEKIAELILKESRMEGWIESVVKKIKDRMDTAISVLNIELGFDWKRQPKGAMFLFPEVSGVYDKMPQKWKRKDLSVGECVAEYFLYEKGVAVVPGNVYGDNSTNYIRMVLCTTDEVFNGALLRLSK